MEKDNEVQMFLEYTKVHVRQQNMGGMLLNVN